MTSFVKALIPKILGARRYSLANKLPKASMTNERECKYQKL